jgi:hypothetical protein
MSSTACHINFLLQLVVHVPSVDLCKFVNVGVKSCELYDGL